MNLRIRHPESATSKLSEQRKPRTFDSFLQNPLYSRHGKTTSAADRVGPHACVTHKCEKVSGVLDTVPA
jgi:hypothetical protein